MYSSRIAYLWILLETPSQEHRYAWMSLINKETQSLDILPHILEWGITTSSTPFKESRYSCKTFLKEVIIKICETL